MVGDIVNTPFPYTDLSIAKERPALVVLDAGMNDWILCSITSKSLSRLGDVEITQADMQAGELEDGYIRTNRLHTLNESIFIEVVGRLTDAKTAEILSAVRSLF